MGKVVTLGAFFSPRIGRADIEVPNTAVAMAKLIYFFK